MKWDSDQELVNSSGLFIVNDYWILNSGSWPGYYSGNSGFKHESPGSSDKMSAVGSYEKQGTCPIYCEKSGNLKFLL